MIDALNLSPLDATKVKESIKNYRRFAGLDIELQLIDNQLVINASQNRLPTGEALTAAAIKERSLAIFNGISIGHTITVNAKIFQNGIKE
jgi:hypothetical protein